MSALYKRISARIRDGVAVAEARNGACTACYMSLRPQVMADVRRGEEVITCDNRSEEHTSELQSRQYLVCRLLLEKKKKSHRSSQRPTSQREDRDLDGEHDAHEQPHQRPAMPAVPYNSRELVRQIQLP